MAHQKINPSSSTNKKTNLNNPASHIFDRVAPKKKYNAFQRKKNKKTPHGSEIQNNFFRAFFFFCTGFVGAKIQMHHLENHPN